MVKVPSEVFEVAGHGGRELKIERYQPATASENRVAVVFPGRYYGRELPLFYYARQVLLAGGDEVFEVGYEEETPAPGGDLSVAAEHLEKDAEAVVQAVRARAGGVGRWTLVGKSMGSHAIALLVRRAREVFGSSEVRLVCFTPLVREAAVRDAFLGFDGSALYVIGTGDPHYLPEVDLQLDRLPRARTVVFQGADHAMEIDGDALGSLEVMRAAMSAVAEHLRAG